MQMAYVLPAIKKKRYFKKKPDDVSRRGECLHIGLVFVCCRFSQNNIYILKRKKRKVVVAVVEGRGAQRGFR